MDSTLIIYGGFLAASAILLCLVAYLREKFRLFLYDITYQRRSKAPLPEYILNDPSYCIMWKSGRTTGGRIEPE